MKAPLHLIFICLVFIAGCSEDKADRAEETVNQHASSTRTTILEPANYVGRETCQVCHAEQDNLWQDSHHDLAMAEASRETVLGDFNNSIFTHAGVTSTFTHRDGKFFVKTDDKDGQLQEFEIKYTFGAIPLQQYLIEFPDGRFQALGIAWDSRPTEQGGQRWFHLYPDKPPKPGEPLHWTGIDQVWNYQCAECHSTNLKKNYDATQDHYATNWSENNVACETGIDQTVFLIAPNVGEPLKPLSSIVSGGELSRVVLALKAILAQTEAVETIVFDEVDAGIGGSVAEVVGKKLAALAKHHQIICITHLPQIAKFGDHHFSISKHVSEGRTKTAINRLSVPERITEIARMLGGEKITKATLDHAREMLDSVHP